MCVGGGVVEHPLPPGGEIAAGQEDGQLGLPVGHRLRGQLERGPGEAAVLALLDVEGEVGEAETPPLVFELGRARRVEGEVDRPQFVGMQGPRVLEGAGGGHVEPVDQHDHHVPVEHRRLGRLGGALFQLLLLVHVLAVQPDQAEVHERADQHDHPCALVELDGGEDQHDERGEDGREPLITTRGASGPPGRPGGA